MEAERKPQLIAEPGASSSTPLRVATIRDRGGPDQNPPSRVTMWAGEMRSQR